MGINDDVMDYVTDRKGHDFRYSIDSKKIESIGFKQIIDFQLGLKETIEWYIANPSWWDLKKKTN
jgi:dTDP-glucose 4,6-dehydratase